jgi:hypothetical protein
VLNAGIKSFRILTHNNQVNARVACRNMWQIADRPEVGEKFEPLAQFNIDARKAAPNGRSHRPLQPNPSALDGFAKLFGNIFVILLKSFGACREALPFKLNASSFEDANRGRNNFRANPVAGDEGYFMSHCESEDLVSDADASIDSHARILAPDSKPIDPRPIGNCAEPRLTSGALIF